ncbi:protein adenylyltransferase SelO [Salinibius halmophilus]|uniref:protein adenylyltransferase SelO n=1 Tax=Salinibius halmophilus TaxID=1853216 RepID=UPI000E662F65|nr:YdiU family protein [Salinibius halmophilus]
MRQVYQQLPSTLFQVTQPTPVNEPGLLLYNAPLAKQLAVPNELTPSHSEVAAYFTGNQLLDPEASLAMGYAGHQFGHYNPQLGDGRAHMLGQLGGYDWQLKGSGLTKYSRGGDGRCALGPAVREYIMSEAMHSLGVPAMRTLAVATTGEKVYRQQGLEQGAVVSRIGASHIRVGSFQYAAGQGKVQALADFTIEQLYPDAANAEQPYLALYHSVQTRLIETLVHWYRVGFIHGVMNTDNIALSGETFDFGPCAMLGDYKLEQVYSSIDHQGRYAFGNQKPIMQWNLARFAETLIPLMDGSKDDAIATLTAAVESFDSEFSHAYDTMCANKLGFSEATSANQPLVQEFWQLLQANAWDYTQTFNQLTDFLKGMDPELPVELVAWTDEWQREVNTQHALVLMAKVNPKAVPRNHEVEALISAAERGEQDIQHQVDTYLAYLAGTGGKTDASWGIPDAQFDQQYQTFCGT